jgi:hypothetical protein
VLTWTVKTVESAIHTGTICISASCSGSNRSAGDFISSIIDSNDVDHLTWMKQDGSTGGHPSVTNEFSQALLRPRTVITRAPGVWQLSVPGGGLNSNVDCGIGARVSLGKEICRRSPPIQAARKVQVAQACHWLAARVRNNDGYPTPRISYEPWYALRLFMGEGEATAAAALLAA